MPGVRANGIRIEYESFGPTEAPPILLVMGLGSQLVHWDEEFCERLAARGHRVIRFDNRDVGLSTHLPEAGAPDLLDLVARVGRGESLRVAYTLADMADDAAALLEALGIERAHAVGVSMGGMIVQLLALRHAERVRSLTSIMSTTGRRDLPPPKPDAMQRLLLPVPAARSAAIEHSVETFRVIWGSGYPFDEARVRGRAALAYDRAFDPFGGARQLAAILASGSRREVLAAVTAPTLVVHGTDDPLVPVEGGLDTHEAVPGSELLLVEGMGHSLPVGAWPALVDGIAEIAARADRGA
jgi:pimeloyl-ACP methyl ester carboxylesterase